MYTENSKDQYIIEEIIDKRDVSYVLELIAETCQLKSEHLQLNWQDHIYAKQWSDTAKIINNFIYRLPLVTGIRKPESNFIRKENPNG